MARMGAGLGLGMGMGVSTSSATASCLPDMSLRHCLRQRPLNLRASHCSKLQTLAPASLYSASFSSAFSRSARCVQLGASVLGGFGRPERRSFGVGVVRGMAAGTESDLESWIKRTNSSEPVVVWSKSYCPYCMRVKKLLGSLGADVKVIELDESGQPGLQDALERISGQYTVPNVFIGGKHIGGCDDTVYLHSKGKLEPLLEAASEKKK